MHLWASLAASGLGVSGSACCSRSEADAAFLLLIQGFRWLWAGLFPGVEKEDYVKSELDELCELVLPWPGWRYALALWISVCFSSFIFLYGRVGGWGGGGRSSFHSGSVLHLLLIKQLITLGLFYFHAAEKNRVCVCMYVFQAR